MRKLAIASVVVAILWLPLVLDYSPSQAAAPEKRHMPGFATWVASDSAKAYGYLAPWPKPSYRAFTTMNPAWDNTIKSTIVRIVGDSGTTVRTAAGASLSRTWQGFARHEYSLKGSPWNSDESLIWIANANDACSDDGGGSALILDGQTYHPIKVAHADISGTDGRWHPLPEYWYVRIYAEGTTLKWMDVRTNTVVKTISGLPFTPDGLGKSEGNVSWDGRFIALTPDLGDQVCIVNMMTGVVGDAVMLPVVTNGELCSGTGGSDTDYADDVKISAWGNFLVASYDDTHNGMRRVFPVDTANTRLYSSGGYATPQVLNMPAEWCVNPGVWSSCGATACANCLPSIGYMYALEHADMSYNPYTADRTEVMVGIGQCGSPKDSGKVVMVRLRDGAVRHLSIGMAGPNGANHYIEEAYPEHLTAQNRMRPGWVYVDYALGTQSDSLGTSGGRFRDEVVAWRMLPDSSYAAFTGTASNPQGKQCQRFGWKHNYSPSCYTRQAQAAVSPTGTRMMFSSNWRAGNQNTATSNAAQAYVIDARGVSSAGPRRIYVNERTGDDRYSGEDSTRAWRSIAKANVAAGPSTVIHIAGGTYRGDPINPAFGGFGAGGDSAMRYVGDLPTLAAANAAHGAGGGVVLKTYSDSSKVTWPYVNISGIKADSSAAGLGGGVIAFRSVNVTYPSVSAIPLLQEARGDSLTFSTFGGISLEGARNVVVYRDSVTNRDSGVDNPGLISIRPRTGRNSGSNEIRRVKMTALLREDAIGIADSTSSSLPVASGNVIDSCEVRLQMTPSSTPRGNHYGTALKVSRGVGTKIHHTRILANPLTSIDTVYWAGARFTDSCDGVEMLRDTLDFGIKTASHSITAARNVVSDWALNSTSSNFKVDSCYLRTSETFRNTNKLYNSRFMHNVFLGTDGPGATWGPGELDGVRMEHNTMVGMGGYAAEMSAQVIRNSTSLYNLYYRNTATEADSAVYKATVPVPAITYQLTHNYNLYYSGTDSCRYAVRFGPRRSSAPREFCGSFCSYDPGSDCWSAFVGSPDRASTWANPSFRVTPSPAVSDSFQFFNGALFCGSAAQWIRPSAGPVGPVLHGMPHAVAVGARNVDAGSTPDDVTTLFRHASTASSITVRWTEVQGSADGNGPAFYVAKYSTSPPPDTGVTDSWWEFATPAPSSPNPGAPGDALTFEIASGLTANARYYVVIRPYNSCLIPGAYSNAACVYASATIACAD